MEILFSDCLKRVEQISGCKITNYKVDCLDLENLRDVFKKHSIYAIINFAALKSVGESVQKPVLYYKNNVGALLNLLTVTSSFSFINRTFLFFHSVWKNLMLKISFFHPQQLYMVHHNIYHLMKNIHVSVMLLPIRMERVNMFVNIFSKIQLLLIRFVLKFV